MFLGQLDNPLGCLLCWVQSFGIDFSAPLLPLSVPSLCPIYLLFFPFSSSPALGEWPEVGAWLRRSMESRDQD
jgi:hypothetical protein